MVQKRMPCEKIWNSSIIEKRRVREKSRKNQIKKGKEIKPCEKGLDNSIIGKEKVRERDKKKERIKCNKRKEKFSVTKENDNRSRIQKKIKESTKRKQEKKRLMKWCGELMITEKAQSHQ